MAFITPGPLELILLMIVVIGFIVQIFLIRFIFRINKQIKLLTEIRDELRHLNAKG
jgi:hypothetical protein